jgi:hypothetical protein
VPAAYGWLNIVMFQIVRDVLDGADVVSRRLEV